MVLHGFWAGSEGSGHSVAEQEFGSRSFGTVWNLRDFFRKLCSHSRPSPNLAKCNAWAAKTASARLKANLFSPFVEKQAWPELSSLSRCIYHREAINAMLSQA